MFVLSSSLQIYTAESHYDQTVDGLIASRISLRLHLQSAHFSGHGIQPAHFSDGGILNLIHGSGYGQQQHSAASGLLLRCTAQIAELYEENTEMELGVPPRDPVPARGECAGVKQVSTFRRPLYVSSGQDVAYFII